MSTLELMQHLRLNGSPVAFSAAVAACQKYEHWAQALQLLRSGRPGVGMETPLHALAAGLDVASWNKALEVFEAVKCHGLRLDLTTCNSALDALSRHWLQALSLASDMMSHSLLPDMLSWICVVQACSRALRRG